MNQQINSKALIVMMGSGFLFCMLMILIVATGFEIDLGSAIEKEIKFDMIELFRSAKR
ncbi:MAG: hypothetical protein L6Q78_13995 [Bacteroidia bacterium]|nr:hypothetical protein [Bacteroidia bacterium]